MNGTRRQFLAAATALPFLPALAGAADGEGRKRLGVVLYSYAIRLSAERAAVKTGLADPLTFVEHCHELGAGGVQTGIGSRDRDYQTRLRKKVEAREMFLEGTIQLPKNRADLDRFTAEVRCAREAGV